MCVFCSSHCGSPCCVLCDQVKSEYAQLKETLGAVTQERDSALREKTQLQGKLENLEQVLKVRVWRHTVDNLTFCLLYVYCVSVYSCE